MRNHVYIERLSRSGLQTGIVKEFDTKRGFGFIWIMDIDAIREGRSPDRCDPSVFVHQTDISMEGFRELAVGVPVEFRIASTERGSRAVDVSPF